MGHQTRQALLRLLNSMTAQWQDWIFRLPLGDCRSLADGQLEDHPNVRLLTLYNEPLSHLIYAAGHFVLVPSMFEPCGLTQLIATRYGTIPIVRSTGGLPDTVKDVKASSGEIFGPDCQHSCAVYTSDASGPSCDVRDLGVARCIGKLPNLPVDCLHQLTASAVRFESFNSLYALQARQDMCMPLEGRFKQQRLHPAHSHIMHSASLDGLVNVFDFSAGIDEDDAFKVSLCLQFLSVCALQCRHWLSLMEQAFWQKLCRLQAALNWDASIARIGFCGASLEHLWLTATLKASAYGNGRRRATKKGQVRAWQLVVARCLLPGWL